jgi:peptidoglycan-associated lipoprotein
MFFDNHKRFGRNVLLTATGLAMAGLGFGGCSTTKPPPEPTQASQAQPQKVQPAGKQLASAPTNRSGSSSSLDQLRQGQRVGSDASSALKDIYFDFDRYDLQPEARTTLKANADWLKQNPSVTVQIEGHCDDRGTAEYNLALGAKRAQAAKDYLTTLGIPAQRVSTISYGEEIPTCREENEACWQQNRHDRFVTKTSPTS